MAIKRNPKTGKWSLDFTCEGQRIQRTGFRKKSDAEKFKARAIEDKEFRKHLLYRESKVSFADFSVRYLKEHSKNKKSYKSDKSNMKTLRNYFGHTLLTQIAGDAISYVDHYKNFRLKQKSYKSTFVTKPAINRELALFRHMLNKAVEWKELPSPSPLLGVKIMFPEKPRDRVLTKKELQLLINKCDRSYTKKNGEPYVDVDGIRLRTVIIIALNTGMRRNEILQLKWNKIDLDERILTTESKNGVIRKIPINDELLNILSKLSFKREGSDYLFINPKTNKPFTDNKKAWKNLLKRSKIDDFRFHDLRHCFATYALLGGGDLLSLQDTLGHTDPRTTHRYLKAMMEGKRKLVEGFQMGESEGELIEMPKKKKQSG
jgi:integrase